MNWDARDPVEAAKDQLRAALLFRNWKAVGLALEALEEVDPSKPPPTAYAASQGGCEFCPADGGGCCVCGGGMN
jgi:hypothetical protein